MSVEILKIITEYFNTFGYLGLLFLLIFITIVPFPLPEDAILIGSGYIIHQNILEIWPTLAVLYTGVFLENQYLYELKYFFRKKIIHIRPFY